MIGDVQADKKPLDQGCRGHKENEWSLEVERRIDGTWELCQDIDWL